MKALRVVVMGFLVALAGCIDNCQGEPGEPSVVTITFDELPCTNLCLPGELNRGRLIVTSTDPDTDAIIRLHPELRVRMGATEGGLSGEDFSFSTTLERRGAPKLFDFFYDCREDGGNLFALVTIGKTVETGAPYGATTAVPIRCPPAGAVISVTGSNGPIEDAGLDVVDAQTPGVAFMRTYTIKNVGRDNLSITGVTAPAQSNCAVVTVTDPSGASVVTDGTTTLVVRVTPEQAGTFTCRLAIANNDSGAAKNPFEIDITGTAVAAPAPEIRVTGSGGEIQDAGTDAVGSREAGMAFSRSYTISNIGNANLTLGAATITTQTNCTATTVDPVGPVAPTASTNLNVTVTPTVAGTFSCRVSVVNNDTGENPFEIDITGTATPAPAPDMAVTGSGGPIADGGQDLAGTQTAGVGFSRSFTINNVGTANLVLSGTNITNMTNCTAVTMAPSSPVLPAGNTSISVSVTATSPGAFSCRISIPNNDVGAKNPYDIDITGTAMAAPAPEIYVDQALLPIANGGSDDVGSITEGHPVSRSYTITNIGNATLTIGTVAVSNPMGVVALVTMQPVASVAPGLSTTFTLSIRGITDGPFSFILAIPNNAGAFQFNVTGVSVGEADIALFTPAFALIDDGGMDVNPVDQTVGLSFSRSYTVRNLGTPSLILGMVTVGTQTRCTVAVTMQPGITLLSPTNSTTIGVSVTPTAPGAFSCQITLASDDPDEPLYDVFITGTASGGSPDIEVTNFAEGSEDDTGARTPGQSFTRSYIIENRGVVDLTLGPIALTGVTNCTATLAIAPTSPVQPLPPPNNSTLFSVSITPNAVGAFRCRVSIPSNDTGSNPYLFDIVGTGTSPPVGTFASMQGNYFGDNQCGIGSMNLTATNGIVVNPFGANGSVTFTLDPTNPNVAFALALIIFSIGGHDCTLTVSPPFTLTVSCTRPGASCVEIMSK